MGRTAVLRHLVAARAMLYPANGSVNVIRFLFRLVLVAVLLVGIGAFFLGYRFTRPAGEPAAGVTGRSPAIDIDKARQTGVQIGETVATGAAQAQQALNEGSLTAKIKAKMALDDLVKASAINVDTVEGVVTLTGAIRSEAERKRAVQLARETAGVKAVTDRLVIR